MPPPPPPEPSPSPLPTAHPTALLRHTLADGAVHYDWLIARPGEERLWAARLKPLSADWAKRGQFTLHPLPPHRRRYLTYEGPLTDGRGGVVRIDAGQVHILDWQERTARLNVLMQHFTGRIDLQKLDATTWSAHII